MIPAGGFGHLDVVGLAKCTLNEHLCTRRN
jgi:hypothetical protein